MNKEEIVKFLDWYHKEDAQMIGHVFNDIADQYIAESVNENDLSHSISASVCPKCGNKFPDYMFKNKKYICYDCCTEWAK